MQIIPTTSEFEYLNQILQNSHCTIKRQILVRESLEPLSDPETHLHPIASWPDKAKVDISKER